MDKFRAAEISASGMAAQKARLEAAAANLAHMHTAHSAQGPNFQPMTAVVRPDAGKFVHAMASSAVVPARVELVPQQTGKPRLVHEPGHPDADSSGMVSYPAVDHLHEMMTVMTAIRAYEANLAALQASKTMALKALEIGGQ